ncbi:hypothetical protein IC614_06730 [Allosphingosinicella flava]|uniref:C-type lysozyme inhibitor domain-containing protein n=1 Tax=Allosphingosinicella flava TaxID=2771430 RepID=A0A7T2LLI3_9SPHN|nr:hypothetical protein [Sphingosinicella flava]QPQ54067.1 hypothetical protein IC614_06730 [Sphingosinicella flava]
MNNSKTFAVAASVAALLSLSACNSEPEVVTANAPDPQAEALQNAAPVELPPAIQASRTYRCKDNSLVYADFYTNNTVKVRGDRNEPGTILTRGEGGGAYKAEGYSVSDNVGTITYAAPGKGSQSCKA